VKKGERPSEGEFRFPGRETPPGNSGRKRPRFSGPFRPEKGGPFPHRHSLLRGCRGSFSPRGTREVGFIEPFSGPVVVFRSRGSPDRKIPETVSRGSEKRPLSNRNWRSLSGRNEPRQQVRGAGALESPFRPGRRGTAGGRASLSGSAGTEEAGTRQGPPERSEERGEEGRRPLSGGAGEEISEYPQAGPEGSLERVRNRVLEATKKGRRNPGRRGEKNRTTTGRQGMERNGATHYLGKLGAQHRKRIRGLDLPRESSRWRRARLRAGEVLQGSEKWWHFGPELGGKVVAFSTGIYTIRAR